MAGKFEPKTPVTLAPPKDKAISLSDLKESNGIGGNPAYVAIKGKVFDVTGNPAYGENKPYFVFVGQDASRALAMSSTKAEDVRPEWEDLGEKEKKVLDDWMTFFEKRYNVVGFVKDEGDKSKGPGDGAAA